MGPRDERLYAVLYPLAYERVLAREAERHRLDRALVAALIRQESNFDPVRTSRAGARGLMQIMPAVGRQLASGEGYHTWDAALLYQPDVSLDRDGASGGVAERYQHVSHALAAYNAGSSRAKRWLEKAGTEDPEVFVERIPFRETRDYVRIILRNRELYRRMRRVTVGHRVRHPFLLGGRDPTSRFDAIELAEHCDPTADLPLVRGVVSVDLARRLDDALCRPDVQPPHQTGPAAVTGGGPRARSRQPAAVRGRESRRQRDEARFTNVRHDPRGQTSRHDPTATARRRPSR